MRFIIKKRRFHLHNGSWNPALHIPVNQSDFQYLNSNNIECSEDLNNPRGGGDYFRYFKYQIADFLQVWTVTLKPLVITPLVEIILNPHLQYSALGPWNS